MKPARLVEHLCLRYSDYVRTDSGLQYQDIRVGSGQEPSQGATVSIDWDGYTIGYYVSLPPDSQMQLQAASKAM